MNLQFTLNGKPWSVDCEPADTLAEVLRNQLNLNGTKVSCEVQVCGACTVLVDNLPVSACTFLAYEARGKNVLTVEGLENIDGTLHPIQQAFIDEFAFQCGYCTPGMIMAFINDADALAGLEIEIRRSAQADFECLCGQPSAMDYLAGVKHLPGLIHAGL